MLSERWRSGLTLLVTAAILGCSVLSHAAEPDRKLYWEVNDIRPGMKGRAGR